MKFYLTIAFILLILHSCKKQSENECIKTLMGTKISKEKVDEFIDYQMELLNMSGLSIAIINDGQVVYHRVKGYSDKEKGILVDNESIFEGASISKPVFAFFVMTFVEDSILDLDKPLYKYLPYPDIEHDKRYEKITARMVLSHRSGFPNWRDDYEDKKLFIQFEPDSNYHYSGEGYQYLAMVLKHILHTNWAGLENEFQKRVAIPFKMTHTKFIKDEYIRQHKVKPYDKDGNWIDKSLIEWWLGVDTVFVAPTTIHSESIDFSKWMIGMMNEKGLTKDGFVELYKTHSEVGNNGFLKDDYTLGFSKLSIGNLSKLYQHNGNNTGFSSYFTFDKNKKWGLVFFTNSKFGDPFTLAVIYDLLISGWSKGKQIALGLALILSVLILVINLVLLFFKESVLLVLRKTNIYISLLVCFGIIATLIFMLVTSVNINLIYLIFGILFLTTIAFGIKSFRNTVNFWKTNIGSRFELIFQFLLISGILISGVAIALL